jgi:hypothetical protein
MPRIAGFPGKWSSIKPGSLESIAREHIEVDRPFNAPLSALPQPFLASAHEHPGADPLRTNLEEAKVAHILVRIVVINRGYGATDKLTLPITTEKPCFAMSVE